ncbi:hypothetical protein ACFL35_16310 [Candidatus Riflebacteria bacterium]
MDRKNIIRNLKKKYTFNTNDEVILLPILCPNCGSKQIFPKNMSFDLELLFSNEMRTDVDFFTKIFTEKDYYTHYIFFHCQECLFCLDKDFLWEKNDEYKAQPNYLAYFDHGVFPYFKSKMLDRNKNIKDNLALSQAISFGMQHEFLKGEESRKALDFLRMYDEKEISTEDLDEDASDCLHAFYKHDQNYKELCERYFKAALELMQAEILKNCRDTIFRKEVKLAGIEVPRKVLENYQHYLMLNLNQSEITKVFTDTKSYLRKIELSLEQATELSDPTAAIKLKVAEIITLFKYEILKDCQRLFADLGYNQQSLDTETINRTRVPENTEETLRGFLDKFIFALCSPKSLLKAKNNLEVFDREIKKSTEFQRQGKKYLAHKLRQELISTPDVLNPDKSIDDMLFFADCAIFYSRLLDSKIDLQIHHHILGIQIIRNHHYQLLKKHLGRVSEIENKIYEKRLKHLMNNKGIPPVQSHYMKKSSIHHWIDTNMMLAISWQIYNEESKKFSNMIKDYSQHQAKLDTLLHSIENFHNLDEAQIQHYREVLQDSAKKLRILKLTLKEKSRFWGILIYHTVYLPKEQAYIKGIIDILSELFKDTSSFSRLSNNGFLDKDEMIPYLGLFSHCMFRLEDFKKAHELMMLMTDLMVKGQIKNNSEQGLLLSSVKKRTKDYQIFPSL